MKHLQKVFNAWLAAGNLKLDGSALNLDAMDNLINSLDIATQREVANLYLDQLARSNTLPIWEFASLIAGQPCGDDSFDDFRRWLICLGLDTFNDLILDPDSFVEKYDAVIKNSQDFHPYVESVGKLDELLSSFQKIRPFDEYPTQAWSWKESSSQSIANNLPKLWSAFGEKFVWTTGQSINETQNELLIPSLGRVCVGDKVRHKKGLGIATITAILIPDSAAVELDFGHEKKIFTLSADYFEICSA